MSDFQSIKYRLIGAAVIVISFIFSWWLLLDHEVHRLQNAQIDIPVPLEIERFDIKKPTIPDTKLAIVKDADLSNKVTDDTQQKTKAIEPQMTEQPSTKQSSTKQQSAEQQSAEQQSIKQQAITSQKTVTTKSAPAMSSLDNRGLPEAWVLQVGSFQDKLNAQQVQKKLVESDLPAYVKVFNLPEGKSYRVLVGPKLSKEKAAKIAKVVEKEHGLKSLIMQYKPGFEE